MNPKEPCPMCGCEPIYDEWKGQRRLYCPDCGVGTEWHPTSDAALHTWNKRAPRDDPELLELHDWLDGMGSISGGGFAKDRVENVLRHYATQIGRWVK